MFKRFNSLRRLCSINKMSGLIRSPVFRKTIYSSPFLLCAEHKMKLAEYMVFCERLDAKDTLQRINVDQSRNALLYALHELFPNDGKYDLYCDECL